MKILKILRIATCMILSLYCFSPTPNAWAADTLVEIFFLPHRPALAVVSEVEKTLAHFDNISIKKYSFDDPASNKLVTKYQLNGHMPIAIYINGRNLFTIGGKEISLRNFPKGNSFVPMFSGEWDYADIESIITTLPGNN